MDGRATGVGRFPVPPQIGKASEFSFHIRRRGRDVVVAVSGDLDAWSADRLRAHLDDLINGQGNLSVVVDGREMSFIDSFGLSVLIDAGEQLRSKGGELRVEQPSRSAARVLAMTGFGEMLGLPTPPDDD